MSVQIGTPRPEKDLMERLSRYTRDHNWIKHNYAELLEKFPKQYIAVKNQDVKYNALSTEELVKKMLRAKDNPADYAIEFLTDEKCSFLF